MQKTLSIGLTQAILVSTIVVAGAAVPAGAQENAYDTTVDRTMGQRVFRAQCGRCHGRDAMGNDETGAPDLTTGTLEAGTDEALFTVVREGIPNTAMIGISPRASDQTVWQIVSYINSLNLDPSDYNLPGDINRGSQLFSGKGNCSNCHMVNGEGGRLGPDLSAIGNQLEPEEIRTALSDPDENVAPRWWTMRVTQSDGSVVEGLRMNEDTFTVRLMDAGENLWNFLKSDVRSTERIKTSTMPSANLTGSELDDVIAYVFSLRRES
jgi:cytochrome c oxidase cbb3-type subunit 3